MCRCTPTIRTPFCGKPGCEVPPEWDKKKTEKPKMTVSELALKMGKVTGMTVQLRDKLEAIEDKGPPFILESISEIQEMLLECAQYFYQDGK